MWELKIASINPSTFAPIERRIEIEKHLQTINSDICLIQETRLHHNHTVASKKYNCTRDDNGVGTLILTKTRYKTEQIFIPAITHINLTAIKIKTKNNRDLIAISIYIPCDTPNTIINLELNTLFKQIHESPFIIGGDLNVGLIRQKREIWKWIDKHTQTLKLITPISPTFRSGSKLDYFIASTDSIINKFCKVDDLGLEHNLIHSSINFNISTLHNPHILSFKYFKCDWEVFKSEATKHQTALIPDNCNISNSEIDFWVDRFTGDIIQAMNTAIPKSPAGRRFFSDLPTEADHYFKERRRLRQTLKRARGKWLANIDRIEHLKREITEATKKINGMIKKSNNDRLEQRIKNINNNVNKYKELRSLSGNPTSRPCLRVKDSQGKEITSAAGKLEELRVLYEDLYWGGLL